MQVYPDAIAQCVYTAFIHAYPTSWNSFDENFKNDLCQYISLWQVGKYIDGRLYVALHYNHGVICI